MKQSLKIVLRTTATSIMLVCLALVTPRSEAAETGKAIWLTSREAGLKDAQPNKRPILIRFVGENCPWCRQLDEELVKPAVQQALQKWTLVVLDIEHGAADARALNVESIPALRVVSPTGRLLVSRDGYLPEEKLIEWLNKAFERATEAPEELLFSSNVPSPIELQKIIRQFGDRDATIREAAIRRLLPHQADAAEAVITTLKQEKLSVRLAVLELLREWQAPIEGLDPWQPETMTTERFARVEEWQAKISAQKNAPRTLSPNALAEARVDLSRLLTADPVTSAAIRERLVRYGAALLPEVVVRQKEATTDSDRSRLLALRYRLVMQDAVALNAPGLADRLASSDVRTRHLAVRELSEHATPDSQPLFLELFADEDPLVRELSLLGLRAASGDDGTSALVKLLDDPEPNVRAAVLKLFAEEPWPELQPRLSAFLKSEQDTGLLVHAVRCFRKLKNRSSAVLLPLLKHRDWQVRAEALDALTGAWQRYPDNETQKMMRDDSVRDAVAECLQDEDPFVVSRAILGVKVNLSKAVVKSLIAIPAKHASLTNDVVRVLSSGGNYQDITLPAMKEFFVAPDPTVRAVAIQGLGAIAPTEIQTELLAALKDDSSDVRIAGAKTLQTILKSMQPTLSGGRWNSPVASDGADEAEMEEPVEEKPAAEVKPSDEAAAEKAPPPPKKSRPASRSSGGGLLGVVRGLFGGSSAPAEVAQPEEEKDDPKVNHLDRARKLGLQRDRWIQKFVAGKGRPDWLITMIAPLEKMSASQDISERIASVVPLIALGKYDLVRPQLTTLAKSGKDGADVLDVLEWLPFADREQLSTEFASLPNSKELAPKLISTLSELGDLRDADTMWKLCDMPDLDPELLSGIQQVLKQLYFGERYWDSSSLTPSKKKRVYDVAAAQLAGARTWRSILALALMHELLPEEAEAEIEQMQIAAQSIADDAVLAKDLRADAFQITLILADEDERTPRLVELLQSADKTQQLLALHSLLNLHGGLSMLTKSHITLNVRNESSYSFTRGEEINPEPPVGVTADSVRPLINSDNEEIRALAGYVMAVSGDSSGLAPLMIYWRTHVKQDDEWDRLIYRAIAANNDSTLIPTLKQIYKQIDDWRISEFYWTIRIMKGPQILEFRKQIRKEKADSLR